MSGLSLSIGMPPSDFNNLETPFFLNNSFFAKKLTSNEIDALAEIVSNKMKEQYQILLTKVKRKK